MKISNTIVLLSLLITVLALFAAGTGLYWQDQGNSYDFTTLRGETVQMYGQGLYRYDTLFTGAAFRGTDALTLLVGIPLLLISVVLYRRGSLRGGLLLTGTLVYFLYVYASLALAAAYNNLFLIYIALFSAGFSPWCGPLPFLISNRSLPALPMICPVAVPPSLCLPADW